ncbi:calcium/sodium antiporter [Clostridium sardiniense]|uniref:Calcium/sodium antiporter n=1 Tax=Clostridium sardiniense TaxID=29369 RepID=A0ABS7KW91_CLOSR|nr:calcium/sodium antiporter [Clostridium sardiniense]MBY0755084.1 calcium/sodium antiporter [Clostridium sardiniense]
MNIVILIIGFILLIKGADIFVDGSSSIAKKIGIPSVIVGLTIVSLGTSAPELAVSSISALQGNNGIAIGNVLGSNIFNTLVVLGGTAIAMPLIIRKRIVKRDFFVNILVAIILYIIAFGISFNGKDGLISRIDGVILLLLCIIYTIVLIRSAIKDKGSRDTDMESKVATTNIRIGPNIIKIIVGIIGIVLGGKFVVDSATNIAYSIGMSEKLVGLTIVAVGTSLPELVTSIVAALKGETEIAIGNVLGSNIFNILLILGLSSTINPIVVTGNLYMDLLFLIIVTIIIGIIIFFNKDKEIKKLNRLEGTVLILVYVVYLSYIIIRN